MSEFDELIASIASEVQDTAASNQICQKTIDDYQSMATLVEGGPRLNMIAWDRS